MITAHVVKFFDANERKDRSLVFCTRECAATAIGAQRTQVVRVPAALAPAIECYCCGFALDEAEPAPKGA